MKHLHTHSTHKYAEVLVELRKRINRKILNPSNFRKEFELPQNFIKACCNLGLIGRCGSGRYTVVFTGEVGEIHGRMISLELQHIEKLRKLQFKIRNNEI